MSIIVPRTCTEILAEDAKISIGRRKSQLLKEFRDVHRPMCCSAILGQARRLRLRPSAKNLERKPISVIICADDFLTYRSSEIIRPNGTTRRSLSTDLMRFSVGSQGRRTHTLQTRSAERLRRTRASRTFASRVGKQTGWVTNDQEASRICLARLQSDGPAAQSPDGSRTSPTFLNARPDIGRCSGHSSP